VGVLNIHDIMLARNVPAYRATRNRRVLKVTAHVAAPGAESAVCDCLVRLMRGAGMGDSTAPVFAAAVKLARKPQIISLYWAYSATPLALGVRVCVKSSTGTSGNRATHVYSDG